MAALKDSQVFTADDHSTSTSGHTKGAYSFVPATNFNYQGYQTEVDLSEFMDKLLEIEEALDSLVGGNIVVEDNTPSAGYITLTFYTDEATPVIHKTYVVNKTTGARTQVS